MTAAVVKLAVIAVIFISIVSYSIVEHRRWQDKWSPISDDEFMLRCSAGTNRDIALRVRRIVSEQLGVDYYRVYPEQSFVDDLGCD
ncbi:acyl carrier protein [Mariniblastus fucicola]|uniref:Acyl carrier protein n=1 Tax=Mariniblastus fucicola TaxID=980251 RepID=A0A5B9PGI8_9BACT|nr:hypothetical protein [Mariniblastus fucicola]QEG22011.1 acyl carrier protein [Mariniblastus fucicola]